MIFLSDRITFSVSVSSPYPVAGMYRYELLQYYEDEHEYSPIFEGNFYYDGVSGSKVFDLTDIIRSRKETIDKNILNNGTYDTLPAFLLRRFKVNVYFTSSPLSSSVQTVVNVYRYPNQNSLTEGDTVFFDAYTVSNEVQTALQGNRNYPLALIPHYPLKDTTNYSFAQTFVHSSNLPEFELVVADSTWDYEEYLTVEHTQSDETSTTKINPIGGLIDFQQSWVGDLYIYDDYNGGRIGVFDSCYSRYYLMWQDRFGGYQSQPFLDNITFSEEFDVTESQNYRNERNKATIQVQPKWKLNSGWIAENVYPLYESIFVSPILILYDSQEDVSYKVIANGSYTEQTYKNQKKMLNIQLDLEAISKQDIIY